MCDFLVWLFLCFEPCFLAVEPVVDVCAPADAELLVEVAVVAVEVCWLRATDETHMPWLLTDGL